jgi:hypothetical protein
MREQVEMHAERKRTPDHYFMRTLKERYRTKISPSSVKHSSRRCRKDGSARGCLESGGREGERGGMNDGTKKVGGGHAPKLSPMLLLTIAVRQPGHKLLVREELAVIGRHEVVGAGARRGGSLRGGGGGGRVCLRVIVKGRRKVDVVRMSLIIRRF